MQGVADPGPNKFAGSGSKVITLFLIKKKKFHPEGTTKVIKKLAQQGTVQRYFRPPTCPGSKKQMIRPKFQKL